MEPIVVTVVTGFLGAGKSTLMERWLGELAGETAVIVNEWAEVGIDGSLLKGRAPRLYEITGGCLCCSSQAELHRALADVATMDPAPARVLIETSGAASPAGVVRALVQGPARERLRLDGIVTVVDGTRLERTLAFDLAIEQLGFADVVVVSHAEALDERKAVEATVRSRAPAAVVTYASRGTLEGGLSLEGLLAKRDAAIHLPDATTPAHAAIDSVAMEHSGDLDEDRFLAWAEASLGEVEARILRIKGILSIEGVPARVIVQGVGEAIEVKVGAPWREAPRRSRLVVLGLGLEPHALRAGFAACATRATEH